MIDSTYELSPFGKKIAENLTKTENTENIKLFMKIFRMNSDIIYHSFLEMEQEFKKERDPEHSQSVKLTHGDEILYKLLEKTTFKFMSMYEPLNYNIEEYKGFYESLKRVNNPEILTPPKGA